MLLAPVCPSQSSLSHINMRALFILRTFYHSCYIWREERCRLIWNTIHESINYTMTLHFHALWNSWKPYVTSWGSENFHGIPFLASIIKYVPKSFMCYFPPILNYLIASSSEIWTSLYIFFSLSYLETFAIL